MPMISPSSMRVPAPAERSEPSTNGIGEQHGERDRHGARDARPEREHVLAVIQRVGTAVADQAPQGAAGELVGFFDGQPEKAGGDVRFQRRAGPGHGDSRCHRAKRDSV